MELSHLWVMTGPWYAFLCLLCTQGTSLCILGLWVSTAFWRVSVNIENVHKRYCKQIEHILNRWQHHTTDWNSNHHSTTISCYMLNINTQYDIWSNEITIEVSFYFSGSSWLGKWILICCMRSLLFSSKFIKKKDNFLSFSFIQFSHYIDDNSSVETQI